MATSFPSHFGSPFITTIPTTRYDSKGRQMNFTETEVQRLEREAFINASKSRSNSPVLSINSGTSSPASSPRKLISEPYADPIELMANRLAEQYNLSGDDFFSSDDEQVFYSSSPPSRRVPSVAYAPPTPKVPAAFKPGHRRKGSSLTAIAEED